MRFFGPVLLFLLGVAAGFHWQDSAGSPPIVAETTPEPALKWAPAVDKGDSPLPSPAKDYETLLSGLPKDEWEAILPLVERINRFRTIDDIAALLDTPFAKQSPPTQTLIRTFGETTIALLSHRAAEIDPRGAIALGLEKSFAPLFPLSFRALAEIDAKDFEELYAAMPADDRKDIMQVTLPVLMKNQPRLGLSLAEEANTLPLAYSQWARHDPDAAASDLLKRPPGPQRKEAMTWLVGTWADSDSAAAIAWARSLKIEGERKEALRRALYFTANKHPRQALQTAIELKDASLISECVLTFARADLQQAFSSVSAIKDQSIRQTAFTRLMNVAADAGDTPMLLQIQSELPTGTSAAFTIRQAIQSLSQEAPLKAIAWIQAADDREMFAGAKLAVLETWIQRDLRAASAYVSDHPELLTEHETISSICRGLASVDPNEAAIWLMNLTDQRMRSYGLRHVIGSWATQDSESATAYALEMEDPKLRQHALSIVGSHLSESKDDVSAWLANLPEQDVPYQTANVATRIADQNSGEAFRMLAPLLEQANPPAEATKAMAKVIGSWARHEPQEAADWLIQQTDHPEMQTRGMAGVIRQTTAASPSEAMAFIDQLEPGPVLDQATVGLVDHLADFDPQTAITRASQITDETLRHRTMRKAIMELARINLPHAIATLEEAKLPQKEIDRIHRDVGYELNVTLP